ncbi:MAG: ABC transporter ATP-binding protein, partial [Bacteroidales bacterium]
ENYLASFKGCVIVVSHDRYFMDKVVDHVLVFEGQGKLKDFPGHYSHYRAWKELQEEEAAAQQKKEAPQQPKNNRPERVLEEKKRLSFKEKREFEQLEAELPVLEEEKSKLETEMSSGTLSNDELMAKSARISELIDEIDEKTMRWLELSEYV